MRTVKNIALVLSTGYILLYFSEHLFWARVRPDDSLGEWIGTWVAYSLLAFVFLLLNRHFKIRNIWALYLAGATFGWMTEGIIVQTTYESLPLSISFTGLAWHALITIWIGWYAIQRSFHSPTSYPTLILATFIGICYGLWAVTWWLEPDGGVASLAEFTVFSFTTTVLVITAYWLANWSTSEEFSPNHWVAILICGLFALYFLCITVPAVPVAGIILPVLLSLTYLGLRRFRDHEDEGSFLNSVPGHIPGWKFLNLLALPTASILIYGLALELDLRWHTNWILYLVSTPLGFILFGVSLYKAWRIKPAP